MKYLIFSSDYFDQCLKHEFDGQVSLNEFEFSKERIKQIWNWSEEYRKIIPMAHNEKEFNASKIVELDNQCVILLKEIINEFKAPVKIKYFSEGFSKFIYC
ncbi:hypothetical protein IQ13_4316 [Lacibacter cauensis]|uniref:Uncharacterized protein n=1 Tax=Lacibacter cauensis TaxID=510947 RepID=A0A562SA96_9BACT|nr:hypothetical protein [Lacibacter cauensis]TWI77510.1 hypothetical protein IQ13_4316 [Lacibacter cauensis]